MFETGAPDNLTRRWSPGRIVNAPFMHGVTYPSPFFDVAHTYLPGSIRQLFRWCRYYYLTNPLIAATVNKLSEYPLTDIVLDTDNRDLYDKWSNFFDDVLQLRLFLLEVGLYVFCYGNALISLNHPFVKWLICKNCGNRELASNARFRMTGDKYQIECKACQRHSVAEVFDQYIASSEKMKLILWNPEDIEIRYNEVTGECTYYYSVSPKMVNEITLGKRDALINTPHLFVEAVHQKKAVVISPNNVFHIRRPSILTGSRDRGWGIPLILPVLKDVFQLQIMKKATEAVLLERMLPLNILFPQPGSGVSDPFSLINLRSWKESTAQEIERWKIDKNYIPILPLPIGSQTVGGEGRSLLLSQEIRAQSEHIIAGMGVPIELIFGGLSYSGSNVSLRMLENMFLRYISDLSRLIKTFLIPKVSTYLGWQKVSARFKPFKMADDLQRKAFYLQLNQLGKISDTTLLRDSDFNPEEEDELIQGETDRRLNSLKKQQVGQAQIQGEISVMQAKYQSKAQKVMAEEQAQAQAGTAGTAPGEPGDVTGEQAVNYQQQSSQQSSSPEMVQQIAQQIIGMGPEEQQAALQQISAQDPNLANEIASLLSQQTNSGGGNNSAGAALPTNLPPRRGSESAII